MTTRNSRSSGVSASRFRGSCLLFAGLAIGLIGSMLGTTAVGASTSAKVAQAKKHLLVLSDMPKGWETEKGSAGSGGNSFPGSAQLASCIGVPSKIVEENPPEANSPYFQNKSQSEEVQDSITIFPSAKNARANFDAMSNSKTPGCMSSLANGRLKSEFAAEAGKGATIGTITVTGLKLADFPGHTGGFVLTFPITYEEVTVNLQIVSVFYISGTLGQEITFNGYGSSFPTSLASHLTSVAIGRL